MLHLVGSIFCVLVIFNQTPTEPITTDTFFPVEKWEYKQAGRRDPFVPLVGLDLGKGGKASHLNVENLSLIGILWGDKGYYALVKDGANKGYILKKGNRVAGGRVASINRQGIIFEITHAGVKTKFELRLQEKKRR